MKKTVIILGLIGFIAIIDTSFMMGIIASYARKLGADEAQSGLIAALYSIVAIPASVIAGVMVDRLGRKKMLALGLAGDTLFVFLYSVASTPLQLAAYRILHALGGSLVYPASLSLVASSVKETQLGRAVSYFLLMVAISVAIGSFTGGVIVETRGFEQAFRILSILLLIGFILALAAVPDENVGVKRARPASYKESLRKGSRNIIAGSLAIFTLYLSFGFIISGVPQLLEIASGYTHEEAAGATGKFIGISSGFSIIFFLTVGWLLDKSKHTILALLAFISLAASMTLLYLYLLENMFLATALLLGFAIASLMTISTWIMLKVGESVRGISMGIQQTVNIIGTALGASLAGILLKYGVYSQVFFIPLTVAIIGLVAYLILARTLPGNPASVQ